MASLNKVLLVGNLTRDPDVRYIPSGTAVADLGLAVSEKYKDKETVVFVDVVVWDKQAENCGKYLSKGSPVLVEGKLQFDQWESEGQKKSKIRVRAERVQFLSRPPAGGGESSYAPQAQSAPQQAEPARYPADNDAGGDDDNLPF